MSPYKIFDLSHVGQPLIRFCDLQKRILQPRQYLDQLGDDGNDIRQLFDLIYSVSESKSRNARFELTKPAP